MVAPMAPSMSLVRLKPECWAGCLAEVMDHLTNLAQQMDQMKACLKMMDAMRVVHLAWQTMKAYLRAGCLAGRMHVMKDALMNLDLHLAVM